MIKDSRALKIARTLTKGRRQPREVRALYAAGLTPGSAAALCGTTRDVLKQSWAKGAQFREIRGLWMMMLANRGVPLTVWRHR